MIDNKYTKEHYISRKVKKKLWLKYTDKDNKKKTHAHTRKKLNYVRSMINFGIRKSIISWKKYFAQEKNVKFGEKKLSELE